MPLSTSILINIQLNNQLSLPFLISVLQYTYVDLWVYTTYDINLALHSRDSVTLCQYS